VNPRKQAILDAMRSHQAAYRQAYVPRQEREPAFGRREWRDQWMLMNLVDAGVSLRDAALYVGAKYPFQYPAAIYPNHYAMLADRGTEWTSADVTMYEGKLPDRACYKNAYLAADELGLKYVEGLSLSRVAPEPGKPRVNVVTGHGWVLDPSTGGIIETMYEEPADHYLGIPYENEQRAMALAATGLYGIAGNDDLNGYDLLRRGILGLDWQPKGGEVWDRAQV